MSKHIYEKLLTANDTGETGTHQAGVHIPKSREDLLALLPFLDPKQKNPDAWLEVADDKGGTWQFRYIYYNNRLHEQDGTRDEYRITHMTKFFRSVNASQGDTLVLSFYPDSQRYTISIRKKTHEQGVVSKPPARVRLRGWRRVH